MEKLSLKQAIDLHAQKKLCGVFEMTNEDYHSSPGLSKSALDNIAKSPFYYQWKLKNPDSLKESLIFGGAYHCKILEPHTFSKLYYLTDTQPRDPKRDEQGRAPLSKANEKKIDAMIAYFRTKPNAVRLISGQVELCFFWTDSETGIQCKCKTDVILSNGIVVDNKTCQSIDPRDFSSTIHDRRYQVQGAWILDGIRRTVEQSGIDFKIPDSFVLLAQEKSEPFRIKAYNLGHASLAQGEQLYRANLETYAKCITTGEWPDLGDEISEIESPVWSFK